MDASDARRRGTRVLGAVASLTLTAGLLAGCGADEPADPAGTTVDAGSGYVPPSGTTDMSHEDMTGSEEGTAAGDGSGDDSEVATEVVIVISDFSYQLPDSVPAGATIVIRNEDGVGHTVTSDDGVFDVAVGPGEEAMLTAPEEAGGYPFHCTPHPAMTATLTVEG